MKKNPNRMKWAKRICGVAITLLFLVALFWAYEHHTYYNASSETYNDDYNMAIGITEHTLVLEQTFIADEDFYGISASMNIGGRRRIGTVHVTIEEVASGEVVMDEDFSTYLMKDSTFYHFATDEVIAVDEPTEYRATFTESAYYPWQGVSFWHYTKDRYADGTLTVDGVQQAGDLTFGIVTSYETKNAWGVFAKRVEVFALIYVFLLLHLLIGVKKLYEQLFRYRGLIAVLLLVFFVANQFTMSSENEYATYVQTGEGSQYVEPIFGRSREIRSDEWLASLPRLMSAEYEGYGATNSIVRATETSGLSASWLQLNYAILAKPHLIMYYFLGSAYGNSFDWGFKIIFGFLIAFEFARFLTKDDRRLSLLGACLIACSSFYMWWSTVDWLIYGMGAIVCFSFFLREKIRWKQLLYGAATAIMGAAFIVLLYPAWEVPAGFCYLILLLWVMRENWDDVKAFTWKNWVIAGVSLAFMASIILVYLYYYMDYMTAVMATVYPGARIDYGGLTIQKLLDYLVQPYIGLGKYVNSSENATFYGVFPLGALLFVYVLYKKRGKDLFMWAILALSVFLGLYCTVGLPQTVARYTLMTYSTARRAVDILGFLFVIMFLFAVAEIRRRGLLHKGSALVLTALSVAPAVICYFYNEKITTIRVMAILVTAILTAIALACLVGNFAKWFRSLLVTALGLLLFVSGMTVHPLMSTLDAMTSQPVAEEIHAITEEDSDAKWISVDSHILSNYLIANGAPTYNSVNYIPNLEFWHALDPDGEYEYVYNRYAHITIELVDWNSSAHLLQEDWIYLKLSTADLVEKTDIVYILTKEDLSEYEDVLEETYYENGIYIYHVMRE